MSLSIYIGDAESVLSKLPAASCQMCVTSIPYWGLRDYDVDGQIGLEETLWQWIERNVRVFRELKRVLKPDGTIWVNVGDSYCAQRGNGFNGNRRLPQKDRRIQVKSPFPSKNLVGQPWRIAFALQDDGGILRRDYIWHKPNACPESCKDRGTTVHEYVFQFSLQGKYYFDQEAVREPVSGNAHSRGKGVNPKAKVHGANSRLTKDRVPNGRKPNATNWSPRPKQNESFSSVVRELVETRNIRSVWTIPIQPYRGAHFATFPRALAERCIKAGSRPGDTVIDIFGGSGTTGEAALMLKRKAVLIDIDSRNESLMLERCGKFYSETS